MLEDVIWPELRAFSFEMQKRLDENINNPRKGDREQCLRYLQGLDGGASLKELLFRMGKHLGRLDFSVNELEGDNLEVILDDLCDIANYCWMIAFKIGNNPCLDCGNEYAACNACQHGEWCGCQCDIDAKIYDQEIDGD